MLLNTLIDVPSLQTLLAAGGAILIDCRFDLGDVGSGRRAWTAAHLPGAHYADLGSDLSGPVTRASGRHPLPHPEVLARFFGGLGIGAETPVIAYDQSNGTFAARAWWLLRWLGNRHAAVLDGGFEAWVAAGGPIDSGGPPRGTPQLAGPGWGRPDGRCIATAEDVLAAAGAPERRVVDARAPERFLGLVEPLDAVAGHVPGAVNHPYAANLGKDGRFLAPAELHSRWAVTLGPAAPGEAIVMCGSGVTACHDLLAMEHAGLSGARLYPGSWSEWIRDPQRPVARG